MNSQLDRAIRQRLLGDRVPCSSGFDLGFFTGIRLQKSIELLLLAPGAAVVIEFQRASRHIAHHRVMPAWQLNRQAFDRAAKELHGLVSWLWQPKPLTGGQNSRRVANLRLNRYNMGQVNSSVLSGSKCLWIARL